ncbi:MAG: type II secretion system F family protein [Chloroflexi bacterium]|nr:type II secretion system F family protein [Chloroflexota bacterium]
MKIVLLITLLVFISVCCLFAAFSRWVRRVNEVQLRLAAPVPVPIATAKPQRARPLSDQLNRHLGGSSLAMRVERQLTAADTNLTVGEYLLIQAGCAVLGLAIGWIISGQFVGGLLLAMGGGLLPNLLLARRRAKRSKAFGDQLPDLLSLLVGSLRAGYGLMHACRLIQQEMPDPMAIEFGQVIKETMLGYSVDDALDHLVERVNNEDLELVVAAIHIQNEVGGSLAEVLATISDTVRERIKFKGDIQAMTGQQRMTGWLLTALPFVIATGMMLLNPSYMMGLFQPGLTLIIPIGAVVMVVVGNLVMRWIMKIEV